jgi:hypothetical protein
MSDFITTRRLAWDCYFAGVVSISLHPGAGIDKGYGKTEERSIDECAKIADIMLDERDKRFGSEE